MYLTSINKAHIITLLSSQHRVVCKKHSIIKDALIIECLLDIPQWQLNSDDSIQCLQRKYKFKSFASVILLTNRIAELA